MNRLNYVITMLERALGTRARRHIMGGALVSASLLLGGLAVTVMTIKTDNVEDNSENELQVY